MTLTIDIGIKNLGWAIINKENELFFDVHDIEKEIIPKNIKKLGIINQRIYILKQFIDKLCSEYEITKIVIEKQVNSNTIAMELMYLLTTLCSEKVGIENTIIYDPKKKFTDLKINYDTRNKAHKKLSIELISKWLNENDKNNYEKLQNYSKKDDICDCIWMNLMFMRKEWFQNGMVQSFRN